MKKISIVKLMQEEYPHLDKKEIFALISCKQVKVDDEGVNNHKQVFNEGSHPKIINEPYVSRGAYKLKKAHNKFLFQIKDKIVLDAGSSTGGFSDYLLQNGAKLVYAVDVGTNQLAYKLRKDERIVNLERTNILDVKGFDKIPDYAVCDISFKSILKIALHILNLTKEKRLIALIKPQFEIKGNEDFNGVIKDSFLREKVLDETIKSLLNQGIKVRKVIESPIKGTKGNIEYLSLLEL